MRTCNDTVQIDSFGSVDYLEKKNYLNEFTLSSEKAAIRRNLGITVGSADTEEINPQFLKNYYDKNDEIEELIQDVRVKNHIDNIVQENTTEINSSLSTLASNINGMNNRLTTSESQIEGINERLTSLENGDNLEEISDEEINDIFTT